LLTFRYLVDYKVFAKLTFCEVNSRLFTKLGVGIFEGEIFVVLETSDNAYSAKIY